MDRLPALTELMRRIKQYDILMAMDFIDFETLICENPEQYIQGS